MNTIWKYELPEPHTRIEMPARAEILTAEVQDGHIMVWALLDPTNEYETRDLYVIPTGGPPFDASRMKYINTVFLDLLVLHVFERL